MRNRGIRWLYDELPELVSRGVITEDTASRLRAHYGEPRRVSVARIGVILCGVLGAALMGAGIILLLAHNWDELSRPVRAVLSFVPLVAGQLIAGYALFCRKDSVAWREGSGVFLALAIGASIALISQTYHISGDLAAFLFLWLVLGMPLIYLLRASSVAVLAMAGIVAWAGVHQYEGGHTLMFWAFVVVLLPHLYGAYRDHPGGPRAMLLAWALCLMLTVATGIVLEKNLPGWWIVVYSALFSAFYLTGPHFGGEQTLNPFRIVGMVGGAVLALMFTYDWVWREVGPRYYRYGMRFYPWASVQDYVLAVALLAAVVALLAGRVRAKEYRYLTWGGLPFWTVPAYALVAAGFPGGIATILFNVCLLVLGTATLADGVRRDRLDVTNAGMATLAALFIARFFDEDISFTVRGVAFILIGAGILGANWFVVRRRRIRAGERA